ncbi:MAG: hypothetical protein LBG96_06480 [Tannerella sp.]|jgi:hypothetical protein|nr:hypothetical protein [Tannerella sp.]
MLQRGILQKQEIIGKKSQTGKKITFGEAFENQKFLTCVNERKFFLDAIKIIAYQAETAMVNRIKKQMANPEQARSLIRKFYRADADIIVDNEKQVLHVKIHRTDHWADDKILVNLCKQLNQTQTIFPGSNPTLFYDLATD